jgi:hypothetical protein
MILVESLLTLRVHHPAVVVFHILPPFFVAVNSDELYSRSLKENIYQFPS